ncbi:hypothetical protein L1887_02171 [Cichorium endivia]|nr:hypothetical protein L1887_02171 [Cichorium endivia]
MTEETYEHTGTRKKIKTLGDYNALLFDHADTPLDEKNKLVSNIKAMRIIRFELPQIRTSSGYVSSGIAIVSTVKAHEQFKSYSLAKIVGILQYHEEEVTKEVKPVSSMGSLALVAKGKKTMEEDTKSDLSDSELSRVDKVLMVSNPKKFFKKNFSRFRNRAKQGNSSSEKPKEEGYKNTQHDEENKIKGDSGYECHYCHGKNHFAKECLLRRQNEKKEKEKDEAYYVQKIEELRKKDKSTAKPAFVVQEDDEDGMVEVWLTDSEDDEVRKPTHGRCLMVQNGVSEQRGYATDGCQTFESCFAATTVSEQVKECEKMVDKSKEHKNMLKEILTEKDKDVIKSASIQKYNLLCKKLNSENSLDVENISEFDESEMSEISVEDEIDCSVFTQDNEEPKKKLILENSIEFVRIVENKGSHVLKEKATFFPKVKTDPNQVFEKTGLDENDTSTSLVNNDNANGCDEFLWSEPIDNAAETKGLSEMPS